MKKSILIVSLAVAFAGCSSEAGEKQNNGQGWTLGNNNSNNNGVNNGSSNNGQNNGQNNGATNNGATNNGQNNGATNNISSNNGTTNPNNVTSGSNNSTGGSSNNATTSGGGLTTHAECNVNSECEAGLFCCPQGFQGGPGTCESSCQMNGGKCGGSHDECNTPTEGCCEQIDLCSERCAENPAGDPCTSNPDCSGGQLCCPSFGGGGSTCADDCGSDMLGGVCQTDNDCGGNTPMCCDLPIGQDKLCLQRCGL